MFSRFLPKIGGYGGVFAILVSLKCKKECLLNRKKSRAYSSELARLQDKNDTFIKKALHFRLTAQKASLVKAFFSVVLQLYS